MADYSDIDSWGRCIWDYHLLHQGPESADMIRALSSHDLGVAGQVDELWHACLAPLIVMSGGLGNFAEGVYLRNLRRSSLPKGHSRLAFGKRLCCWRVLQRTVARIAIYSHIVKGVWEFCRYDDCCVKTLHGAPNLGDYSPTMGGSVTDSDFTSAELGGLPYW